MARYVHHIFICENQRDPQDPRGSCGQKGSAEIREAMKKRVEELGLKATVRVNSAGCLNACGMGPSMVIYPEGIWYAPVQLKDVEEILQEHVIGGRIVARLQKFI